MRLFEKKQYKISGRVVSLEDFKPYLDIGKNVEINELVRKDAIEIAENRLKEDIPILLASEYMMFKRNGNRSVYEEKYFLRRNMLVDLAVGEYIEKKGRFLDKIIDLVWLILDETTWILPAHNPNKEGVNTCLPYAFRNDADCIALFSASSGADLATVYFLLKDEFDKVSTIINDRILFELETRIVKPFMDLRAQSRLMNWTGVKGNKVNNWCPWIISNILTVCAFAVKDIYTREAIVRMSMPMLDNFISGYKSDGGCDEGPNYWGAAGGALINACNVLYDITNGYVNIFDEELIRKMGEYEVKVFVTNGRFLNFADSPAKLFSNAPLIYEWGVRCNSEMMITYGKNKLNEQPHASRIGASQPYTALKFLCKDIVKKENFVAPTSFYLDGLKIAGKREFNDSNKGLYLAIKGGNNGESHNHNDIGNIIVFADGEPIFIDAGCGTYSKRTFSSQRYEIWSMCSEYHNVPTINGVNQKCSAEYHSSNEVYDEQSGKLTLCLNDAYPKEAKIKNYTRSAILENHKIIIEDDISFEKEGTVIFNYLTNIAPKSIGENSFVIRNKTITFDKTLDATVEVVDCSEEETREIPKNWDTENIFRIRLSAKSNFTSKKFIISIN